MAVPKRKVSKARRDKRRSNVWKLGAPTLAECPQCHALKAPHKACPECGYVNADLSVKDGKITVKAAAAKKEEAKVVEETVAVEETEAVEEASAE
ncbi:MAG: 50S ribosomal protein L32 [Clostridia bacterium]|nr:50S ribosomal protein L32 [Clostridia bacterium]